MTVRSGREPGGVARQDNQYRYVVTTPVYRFQVMYPFWKFWRRPLVMEKSSLLGYPSHDFSAPRDTHLVRIAPRSG